MKIAVIGSGGREHAIIKKLQQSPKCTQIFALPGNGGISQNAQCVPIKATDVDACVNWCCENNIDYVVVTPDDPLALGMVDALSEKGIAAFGPVAAAARIEASKAFAKQLMQQHDIPTAAYACFDAQEAALAYIRDINRYPVVIKADGLALGKGVYICQNEAAAESALAEIMQAKVFGDAGATVVVEEFLRGPEVSVLAFCDGETLVPMVSSMDHKRAWDGDLGLNTGGMGTVAPNPYYTPDIAQRCYDEIFMPTLNALAQAGTPFKGCLYFGLMLTSDGPKVIEFNCRFGDPETQVILPLLQGDLLEIMLSCTNGTLSPADVNFSQEYAACVVMSSSGYPLKYKTGFEITGMDNAASKGTQVYHAGTRLEEGKFLTAGGRVLGITATASTLSDAIDLAYEGVDSINFEGAYCRRDIGRGALELL